MLLCGLFRYFIMLRNIDYFYRWMLYTAMYVTVYNLGGDVNLLKNSINFKRIGPTRIERRGLLLLNLLC